ncbi:MULTISPECIES: serine hydrolase domain-containing protein [Citricoccus]|uniref:serine hydrolase domain-containing protein n=1 Tax=Citricoccus TaxID=169133 RepID=UPI000255F262|nr:serine hydrolase domain-containing protein [Citricoccus sp. CH26A]
MRRRPAALVAASALVVGISAGGMAPAAAVQASAEDAGQGPPTSQGQPFLDRLDLQERLEQRDRPEQQRLAPEVEVPRPTHGDGDRESRQLERALDRAAQGLVEDGAVGVTARVDSPDFSWRGSAGHREIDRRPQARPQDRFRVGSITKAMVATVALQEIERGNLALDTEVEDIVPGLFPGQPDVTVEHLLSHRSGAQTASVDLIATRMTDLSDWNQFIAALGEDYTPQDHLDVVNALPWLFAPGADFSYSNAGYVALGVVLEEVTGEDLGDLLEDRVFDEAGMHHSSFPDESRRGGRFLTGAMWTGGTDVGGVGWQSLSGFDPDVFDAAGAVVSTTRDLNRFAEALTSGELVHEDLVEEMVTPRTGDVGGYGLGIYRLPDPCTGPGEAPQWIYGHDGLTFGTAALVFSSADGTRQVSLGATGRDMTSAQPLTYDVNELLLPMLEATCES